MSAPGASEHRREEAAEAAGWTERVAGLVFHAYRTVASPLLHAISPTRCIYLPTCSEYAYTAVSRFGMARGGWMAVRRFARCHPFAKGGLDPVPASRRGSDAPVAPRAGADHLP